MPTPARKRPAAASSALTPAARNRLPTLDSDVLQAVHDVGAYPRRFKKPVGEAQCRENALAMKIQKRWQELLKGTQQELTELKAKNAQQSEEDTIETLMTAVRKFGCFPR